MPQSLLKSWKHRLVCIQRCSAYALGWRQLSVSAAAASAPECLSHFIRIIWRRSTREDVWMAKQVNAAADNTIAADTKLTEPRWHLWSVLDGNALCELSVQTSCLRCFYHLMLLQTAVLLQLCPSYIAKRLATANRSLVSIRVARHFDHGRDVVNLIIIFLIPIMGFYFIVLTYTPIHILTYTPTSWQWSQYPHSSTTSLAWITKIMPLQESVKSLTIRAFIWIQYHRVTDRHLFAKTISCSAWQHADTITMRKGDRLFLCH